MSSPSSRRGGAMHELTDAVCATTISSTTAVCEHIFSLNASSAPSAAPLKRRGVDGGVTKSSLESTDACGVMRSFPSRDCSDLTMSCDSYSELPLSLRSSPPLTMTSLSLCSVLDSYSELPLSLRSSPPLKITSLSLCSVLDRLNNDLSI